MTHRQQGMPFCFTSPPSPAVPPPLQWWWWWRRWWSHPALHFLHTVTHGAPAHCRWEASLIPHCCRCVLQFRTVVHRCSSHMTLEGGGGSYDAGRQSEVGWGCVYIYVCLFVRGWGRGWVCAQLFGWRWQRNIMWSRLWTKSGPAGLVARLINCWAEGALGGWACRRVCVSVCVSLGVCRLTHA